MCTTTTTLILFEFYFRCVSEEQAREETNPIIVWRSRQPNGPVLVYLHKSHPEERARMMREDVDCCVCVCECAAGRIRVGRRRRAASTHTHRAQSNFEPSRSFDTEKDGTFVSAVATTGTEDTHGRRRGLREGERFAQCANQLVEFEMHITFQ